MALSKPNIVVFGETGAGKSSIVNLLLGSKRAKVSDGAVGCTFQFDMFDAGPYNVFDTVGLAEGSRGTMNQKDAVSNLVKLLKSLESGVSLLAFVMEKGRIKKTLEENYKLFVQVICNAEVPVILVITHCEMEMERGTWWRENKQHFDDYGLRFASVVSGCCMDPETVPPMMREHIAKMTQDTLAELKLAISSNMLSPGWVYKGGWKNWFLKILSEVLAFLVDAGESLLKFVTFGLYQPKGSGGIKEMSRSEMTKRLIKYFVEQGHDEDTASSMANNIENLLNN